MPVDKTCLKGAEGNTSAIKLAATWEDERRKNKKVRPDDTCEAAAKRGFPENPAKGVL